MRKLTLPILAFLFVAVASGCGTTKFYGLPENANKADAAELEVSPFISIREVNGTKFEVAADIVMGSSSRVFFAPGTYDLALDWRDTNYFTASTGMVLRKGFHAYSKDDGTVFVVESGRNPLTSGTSGPSGRLLYNTTGDGILAVGTDHETGERLLLAMKTGRILEKNWAGPLPKQLSGERYKHLKIVVEKGRRYRISVPLPKGGPLWFDPAYQCDNL